LIPSGEKEKATDQTYQILSDKTKNLSVIERRKRSSRNPDPSNELRLRLIVETYPNIPHTRVTIGNP
jgi:hypothetical protein